MCGLPNGASSEALRAELPELEVAERVFARLTDDTAGTAASAAGEHRTPLPAESAAATTKPAGTPTISEMIVLALQDARARGYAGLKPKGMTEYIAATWWPNVPGVSINPIAWRMWKRGDLVKEGPLYKLLPENPETADLLSEGKSAGSDHATH